MTELFLLLLIAVLIYQLRSTGGNNKNSRRGEKKKAKEAEQSEVSLISESTTPKCMSYQEAGKNCDAMDSHDLEDIDYQKAYQARYLLTKNEWRAFKDLQRITDIKEYMICPKVRLLDIIEPVKSHKKYMTLFYKVQSKHVDFVICDRNAYIKAVIELDDSSHDRVDRMERDQFVDEILNSIGYKVIHTRTITPDILDQI